MSKSVPARFCTGSILRHTVTMAGAGTLGLVAVFAVDLFNLFYISLLREPQLTAAVAFTGAVSYLQMAISIGMTIGLGAVVSRKIGAGKGAEAGRTASASLVVMAAVMVLIGGGTVLFLRPILHALGASGAVVPPAAQYVAIVSPFLPLIAIGMGCSALLRSLGDARRSMTVTLWAAGLLACLDPLLIFALHLGLVGAAIGTVISRATTAGLGLLAVRRHRFLVRPVWRSLLGDVRPVAGVAIPAILTNIATPIGGAFTTHVMARFGLEAVTGVATINRIVPVAFAFVFALTGSVGPIMAQNLGAGQVARVRRTLLCALGLVLGCVLVMWAILGLSQDLLIDLFRARGEDAALLHLFCNWVVASFLFTGTLFVANTAFNNLGAPLLSTLFNWGRATLGTIPFVLVGAHFGASGVLIGQALGGVPFGILAVGTAFWLSRRLRPGQASSFPDSPMPALSNKAAMVEMAELAREESA